MNTPTKISREELAKRSGLTVEQLDHALQQDEFVRRANATPLPGVTAQAFAIVPDIKVGDYSIRPMFDGDYEDLQTLGHPLATAQQEDQFSFRGQEAWTLCWWFTRPFEDAEEVFAQGNDAVKKAAKVGFCKMSLATLIALQTAIYKQVEIFWSPILGYESKERGDDGAKKSSTSNVAT